MELREDKFAFYIPFYSWYGSFFTVAREWWWIIQKKKKLYISKNDIRKMLIDMMTISFCSSISFLSFISQSRLNYARWNSLLGTIIMKWPKKRSQQNEIEFLFCLTFFSHFMTQHPPSCLLTYNKWEIFCFFPSFCCPFYAHFESLNLMIMNNLFIYSVS